MSTFKKTIMSAIKNREGGPVGHPREHGSLALGRGLGISAILLALILTGLMVVLSWPSGSAAAASGAPACDREDEEPRIQ